VNSDDKPTIDPEPRELLEGTCSLAFEGQEFTRTSGGSTLWLEVSDEIRSELARRLGLGRASLDGPLRFYAKFMGRIEWAGPACRHGHLGSYAGTAVIDEIIDARIIHDAAPRSKARSIRELLRAGERPAYQEVP